MLRGPLASLWIKSQCCRRIRTAGGSRHVDEEAGTFSPGEVQDKAARVMLDELVRWAEALRPLRSRRTS